MLLSTCHHVSGDIPALSVLPGSAALVCVSVATLNAIRVSVNAQLYSNGIGTRDIGVIGVNEDA